MSVQDWHTHAVQASAPAPEAPAGTDTDLQDEVAAAVRSSDLAADLAALTRVLLGITSPAVRATPAPAAFEPVVEPLLEEPAFVAPALVEVPPLVEVEPLVAMTEEPEVAEEVLPEPAPQPRVTASQLIDELAFLDV